MRNRIKAWWRSCRRTLGLMTENSWNHVCELGGTIFEKKKMARNFIFEILRFWGEISNIKRTRLKYIVTHTDLEFFRAEKKSALSWSTSCRRIGTWRGLVRLAVDSLTFEPCAGSKKACLMSACVLIFGTTSEDVGFSLFFFHLFHCCYHTWLACLHFHPAQCQSRQMMLSWRGFSHISSRGELAVYPIARSVRHTYTVPGSLFHWFFF